MASGHACSNIYLLFAWSYLKRHKLAAGKIFDGCKMSEQSEAFCEQYCTVRKVILTLNATGNLQYMRQYENRLKSDLEAEETVLWLFKIYGYFTIMGSI